MRSCPLLAFASAAIFSLSVIATAESSDRDPDLRLRLANAITSWQSRIVAERLPVADPANWALRNMAKLSRLSDERIRLFLQATTIEELDLALVEAPIPEGTSLELLQAVDTPGISFAHAAQAKVSGPGPTPLSGLVFNVVSPCRIYDSRPSAGGPGFWMANGTYDIQVEPIGGSFAFQGGSSGDCGLSLVPPRVASAVMAAVSTVNQTGPGYLVFFTLTNPAPLGVSQWFPMGVVTTSYVVMGTYQPLPGVGVVRTKGYVANSSTHVIIDVVGYFSEPRASGFNCHATNDVRAVPAGSSFDFSVACTSGYSYTGGGYSTGTSNGVWVQESGQSPDPTPKHRCRGVNSTSSGASVTCTARCCRTFGS